jgi:hypothetical protein
MILLYVLASIIVLRLDSTPLLVFHLGLTVALLARALYCLWKRRA